MHGGGSEGGPVELPGVYPFRLDGSYRVGDMLDRLHRQRPVDEYLTRRVSEEQQREALDHAPSKGAYAWVAYDAPDSDNLAGFAVALVKDGGQSISSLYVSEPWEGKGLAGRLMECALDGLDPAKPTELHVDPCNERAKAFYRKWGFREERELDSGDPPNLITDTMKMVRPPKV